MCGTNGSHTALFTETKNGTIFMVKKIYLWYGKLNLRYIIYDKKNYLWYFRYSHHIIYGTKINKHKCS